MSARDIASEIFYAGVHSVLPSVLIPASVTLKDNCLIVCSHGFNLDPEGRIFVIGAGKASAMMAARLEEILGDRITGGHIVVKYGHSCRLRHIKVTEAGHPVPDENGFRATGSILKIASGAGERDLVICLISGGGSALLSDFPEGSSPAEMMKLNDLLVNSGACITEINAVRKHLSSVKGGQLARAAYPATVVSLILSDVPGDPVDAIASGPTAPDPTTFSQAFRVLEKYELSESVPAGLKNYIEGGMKGLIPDTPKPADRIFEKTYNILIGTNSLALESSRKKATEYNINALIVDRMLQGDTQTIAEYIAATALQFQSNPDEVKPVCLLFGGESTVKMTGKGKGGRNQHLALQVAVLLKDHHGITFLAGGTDGNDGPTDAAGAVVDCSTYNEAVDQKLFPEKYLNDFDSYHFFKKAGGHIITGPTMTNVMDLLITIIGK